MEGASRGTLFVCPCWHRLSGEHTMTLPLPEKPLADASPNRKSGPPNGSPRGITKDQPTIAELLKPLGYTSGQFGKNHLGDRDDHLPTNHGFDEFFGNLYHLNTEEEPEGYY